MVKSVAIALLVAVVATSIVGPSSDHNDLVLINCMGVPSTSKLDNLVPELHNLFSFNANCSILVHPIPDFLLKQSLVALKALPNAHFW